MKHLLCLLLAFLAVAASPLDGRKPNIILLITDDQGYADLSCHGNPVLKTPNLDRLHAEGVRFTDFHVSPTCAPTRSSLFSGKHEFKNGVTHTILERERMSLKTYTMAQALKSVGYTTGIFGKWHLGDEDAYQPGNRGFDEVFIHGCGGIGQKYPGSSCADAPDNSYFDPFIRHNGTFEKTKGYCTDVFFDQATKWIDKTKGKQPFFAYISTNAPHAPLDVRPEEEARYKDKATPNQAKFFGMIANIDDNVGKLLAKLKEWEIERDTLFIFLNDNGGTAGVPVFNAGMRGQKVMPYRGGTRGANFWRWPGTLQPGDRTQLAAHIDIFPTLASITGAKVPEVAAKQWDGLDLANVLAKADTAWPERFLFTHVGRWPKGEAEKSKLANCSVRFQQYNMVSAVGKKDKKPSAPAWELFDLSKDIGEKVNLIKDLPEVAARMEKAYDAWWKDVLPLMENETVTEHVEMPYHAAFRKQFAK